MSDLFDTAGGATTTGGAVDMGRIMTFFYNILLIGASMAVGTCVFFILGGIAAVRRRPCSPHPLARPERLSSLTISPA